MDRVHASKRCQFLPATTNTSEQQSGLFSDRLLLCIRHSSPRCHPCDRSPTPMNHESLQTYCSCSIARRLDLFNGGFFGATLDQSLSARSDGLSTGGMASPGLAWDATQLGSLGDCGMVYSGVVECCSWTLFRMEDCWILDCDCRLQLASLYNEEFFLAILDQSLSARSDGPSVEDIASLGLAWDGTQLESLGDCGMVDSGVLECWSWTAFRMEDWWILDSDCRLQLARSLEWGNLLEQPLTSLFSFEVTGSPQKT